MLTNEQIINAIKGVKKGTYLQLTKQKDLGEGIIKETDMRIRIGVSYQNLSINEGREVKSLPWGHWVEGLENIVLEHKGNYYLRITSTNPEHPDEGDDVLATRYIKDNETISKEEAMKIVDEKKFKGNASPIYNIKFENIVRIG